MKFKYLKVATFNTQGLRSCKIKRKKITEDAERYDIQVMGITETHIKESTVEHFKSKQKRYTIYHNGIEEESQFTGVGIVIEEDIPATFTRVNDRICYAELKLGGYTAIFIVAYAPTLKVSEENPGRRDKFYECLSEVTTKANRSRHLMICCGDFNAKTGTGYEEYPRNIGKFGKGMVNSNGRFLLEYAKEFDMILTNTTFDHKMCHRTTWISPERTANHNHFDGTERRNPYRNQIDYILVKNSFRRLVQDCRSYGGFETSSDHKPVILKMKLDWWKLTKKITSTAPKINFENVHNEEMRNEYSQQVASEINKEKVNEEEDINLKWEKMVEI